MGIDKRKRKRRITASFAIVAIVAADGCRAASHRTYAAIIDKSSSSRAPSSRWSPSPGRPPATWRTASTSSQNAIERRSPCRAADPDDVVPALAALQERFGFADIAVRRHGRSSAGHADGSAFSRVRESGSAGNGAVPRRRCRSPPRYENDDGRAGAAGTTPRRDRWASRWARCTCRCRSTVFVYVRAAWTCSTAAATSCCSRGRTGEVLVPSHGRDARRPSKAARRCTTSFKPASKRFRPPRPLPATCLESPAVRGLARSEDAAKTWWRARKRGSSPEAWTAKECYVCVSPVGEGPAGTCATSSPWRTCVPKAPSWRTAFKAVFAISVVCIAVAAAAGVPVLPQASARTERGHEDPALRGALRQPRPGGEPVLSLRRRGHAHRGEGRTRSLDYPLARAGLAGDKRLATSMGFPTGERRCLRSRARRRASNGFGARGVLVLRRADGGQALAGVFRASFDVRGQGPASCWCVRDVTAEKEMQLSMKEAMDGRRGRQPGEVRVPLAHEPRDPHAHERHHRHAATLRGSNLRRPPRGCEDAWERSAMASEPSAQPDQRRAGHLEDRERQDGAFQRAVLPWRRDCRPAGSGQGPVRGKGPDARRRRAGRHGGRRSWAMPSACASCW